MRASHALLASALVVAAVAGCVAPPDASEPAGAAAAPGLDVWARVRGLMADVPCEADVGAQTSANLLKLGEIVPEELHLGERAATGEMDARGDLLLVARDQMGGLFVVDASDPTNLSLVGALDLPDTVGLDVKWLPDGRGALVGDFGAVHVVDLADPAKPALASTFSYRNASISGQAHMLAVAEIANETWVYVASQSSGEPLYVLKLDGWELTLAGSYELPAAKSLPLGNHDMTVYHDELLGKPVLYVADGLAGWSAADLSDPARPQRIGGSLSLEPGPGYTHTVRVAFIDGKRIVATMAEVGVNTLKVYDATNLQAPVLLARWNADAARPHVPQHNIQLVNEWLYMGHYTEGVYVFNLSAVARGPPLVGSVGFAPVAHYAVEKPTDPDALGFANVWEVLLIDGVVYVNDLANGVHAVGFGCIEPGDAAHSATL